MDIPIAASCPADRLPVRLGSGRFRNTLHAPTVETTATRRSIPRITAAMRSPRG